MKQELKLAYSDFLVPSGYYAITLFGYLVRRKKYKDSLISSKTWIHENIHHRQSIDFGLGFAGYFIFYLLYGLEWLLKLPFFVAGYRIYRSLSFEQEAYKNESNKEYLEQRKRFAWVKYIFKLVK